jgi:pyrimidine deaminase RibD-like protein
MRLKEFARTDYEVRNYHKLDKYLSELCDLVEKGQDSNKDFGMVAAGILPLKGDYMARLNRPGKDGRIHAEHAVIEDFIKKYGSIPEGSVIITTLSPCNTPMDERDGPSCADLLNKHGIQKVYCGYIDPTQHDGAEDNREYNLVETSNKELRSRCEAFADTFLDKVHENLMSFLAKPVKKTTSSAEEMRKYFEKEKAKEPPKYDTDVKQKPQQVYTRHDENFADGRNPQDKGDSKRHHVPTKSSVSNLRKFAKNHSGRAAQLAHWMANMKSGHKK